MSKERFKIPKNKVKDMFKLHWSVWSIIILCLIAVLILIFEAMFQNKAIPEGALAIFSSIATTLIGYGAGKGEK